MKKKETTISLLLKGAAIGAANVIPGVSGGTIALITGIYQRLIDAIKSFDKIALNMAFQKKWKDIAVYTDLKFLALIFFGVGISIISLAKVFEYLFNAYPTLLWAYFFGLILGSVYFVGKRVKSWNWQSILSLILGLIIAIFISNLSPASANESFFYLFLCGIAGICSMILPGLSGSFILIIMGNYLLILNAIGSFNFKILIPVAIGAAVGLVAFSNVLSYVFKKFPDLTIALMTGFILGSLNILWPWKEALETFTKPDGEVVVLKYGKILPQTFDGPTLFAFALMLSGILSIWFIENWAGNQE